MGLPGKALFVLILFCFLENGYANWSSHPETGREGPQELQDLCYAILGSHSPSARNYLPLGFFYERGHALVLKTGVVTISQMPISSFSFYDYTMIHSVAPARNLGVGLSLSQPILPLTSPAHIQLLIMYCCFYFLICLVTASCSALLQLLSFWYPRYLLGLLKWPFTWLFCL